MTDAAQIIEMMGAVSNFGVAGLMFVIWYTDMRHIRSQMDAARKDREEARAEMRRVIDEIVGRFDASQDRVLEKTREYIAEQRKMYETNICLVEDYRNLAADLRQLVVSNTEKISKLTEGNNGN